MKPFRMKDEKRPDLPIWSTYRAGFYVEIFPQPTKSVNGWPVLGWQVLVNGKRYAFYYRLQDATFQLPQELQQWERLNEYR